MKLTYCGHSAVLIEDNNKTTIAIDPWLNGNPSCPNNLKNPSKIDIIALDHASEAAALAKKTGAKLIATWELANIMINEGVPTEQVVPMNKGGGTTINDVTISLTHALHSNSFDTSSGPVYAGEACGVVIGLSTHTIYHAGDTALFSDMQLIGEFFHPDIALLPIGDRFTMGPKSAARAAKFLSCKIAIPIHHATFPELTGSAEAFAVACRDLNITSKILAPGEDYIG